MTSQSDAYPGYATLTFASLNGQLIVRALPWSPYVGWVDEHSSGWTATSDRGAYVGLFPTRQAAGEALVRHAGYELLQP